MAWAKIRNNIDDKKEEIGFTFCPECMNVLLTEDQIISILNSHLGENTKSKIEVISIQKYF